MSERQYSFGRFALQPSRRVLLRQGAPVQVGARAFDLLVALVQRADRVVDSRELIDVVWGDADVEPANLQVQVSALRRILGRRCIATVPRKGYGFIAPVRVSRSPARHARQGRTQGLALHHPLSGPGLVTLVGASPEQRRHAARQWARDCAEAIRTAVWWFSLPPPGDAQGLMTQVSRCAGPASTAGGLIVIDDCDRCTRWAREIARLVTEAWPACTVLALAGTPLRVAGERIERCAAARVDAAARPPRSHPLRRAAGSRGIG